MGISYNDWITPSHIYQCDGGVYGSNQAGQAAFDYFPDDAAVDDALYFGRRYYRFDDIQVYIGTPFAADDVTFTWEYWNGSAWGTLSVTDGTNNWTNLGEQTITFLPPDDWRYQDGWNGINSIFLVRCRISEINTPSEGGANSTQEVKVGDNTIIITGYTEGSPCCYSILNTAYPDIIVKQGLYGYIQRARIEVGDDVTSSWFKDNEKAIYIPTLVQGADYSLIHARDNATIIFGLIKDETEKIGWKGCSFFTDCKFSRFATDINGIMHLYG